MTKSMSRPLPLPPLNISRIVPYNFEKNNHSYLEDLVQTISRLLVNLHTAEYVAKPYLSNFSKAHSRRKSRPPQPPQSPPPKDSTKALLVTEVMEADIIGGRKPTCVVHNFTGSGKVILSRSNVVTEVLE